ncbi:MAG: CotH kinase family protein [Nannocystis sp.]|nr:CotH kinase family protein [Nannocystis sp.]MBA3547856.1 CotH kinase family protein [Nannocystis sp.]
MLPIDCAAIARIVPTGVGISDAHVARRHLHLEDASGAALGPEFQACLFVTNSQCEVAPVALAPAPSRSITALLVRPDADPAANAALAEALSDFIDLRPEGEQIGVFRWGATVTQISTPTADKARLHRLVASGLQPPGGDSLPIAGAIAAIADPLVSLERDSHLSLRQLIIVAPGHAPIAPKSLELGGDAAHLRVELLAGADVEAALQGTSARIDAALAAGELVLRQCGLDGLLGLTLHTAGGGPSLALPDLYIVGADQAEGAPGCDPTDQGLTPALPKVIEITFSPTELLDYEARLDELSKEPFYGSVRTDLNAQGVHARVKLKLHGQGSLDCERKSLSLNLTDDLARQWLPDSGTDKFILVSMCKDDRYITQFTANLLMAERGLFAPKFQTVELMIGGESQGVYLLVEKPDTVLERGTTRTRMIVRRANDIKGAKPSLDYAVDDEAQALATYEALITTAESLKGAKLVAWLEQAMDLDQFLRWIALMSLLQSGDFIDEVYFVSTEVTGPNASAEDYFNISTWDQDGIFTSCHNDGLNAMPDPHGLLNCVEGRLDRAIFGEPKLYERFAKELEVTLAWLDQETFDAATHVSEDRVLEVLASDEARAAMVELLDDNPAAVAYEVAEEEVLARGAALRQKFAKRRALLVELLAAYDP